MSVCVLSIVGTLPCAFSHTQRPATSRCGGVSVCVLCGSPVGPSPPVVGFLRMPPPVLTDSLRAARSSSFHASASPAGPPSLKKSSAVNQLSDVVARMRLPVLFIYSVCVFCVGPLCGPPLRWWVLCGALPSVWVPCVGPLCGSPVRVPCVPCAGPLCGSPVWVPGVGPLCGCAASMWHLLA